MPATRSKKQSTREEYDVQSTLNFLNQEVNENITYMLGFMAIFFLGWFRTSKSGQGEFSEIALVSPLRLVFTIASILLVGYSVNQIRKNFTIKKIMYTSACMFFLIFTTEHIMRQNDMLTRPSFYLENVANNFRGTFYTLGVYWAVVSSFIHRIKFEEFFKTAQDLVSPSLDIMFSFAFFLNGYLTEVMSYKYSMIVLLGSVLLIVLPVVAKYFGYLNWTKRYIKF